MNPVVHNPGSLRSALRTVCAQESTSPDSLIPSRIAHLSNKYSTQSPAAVDTVVTSSQSKNIFPSCISIGIAPPEVSGIVPVRTPAMCPPVGNTGITGLCSTPDSLTSGVKK